MNSSSRLRSPGAWLRHLVLGFGIAVAALVLGLNIYVSRNASPDVPVRHISQQEANKQCPSGIALAEETAAEDVGDGTEMTHAYYPCYGSGTQIDAYQ